MVNSKYQKEVDPQFLYVTFVQNKGFIIADFKLGTVFCINYFLEKFVSSVEVCDLRAESNQLLFLMGDKKGNLIVVRWEDKKEFESCFYIDYHTGLITDIKCNPSY